VASLTSLQFSVCFAGAMFSHAHDCVSGACRELNDVIKELSEAGEEPIDGWVIALRDKAKEELSQQEKEAKERVDALVRDARLYPPNTRFPALSC
jgi:hypothetical protein